MQLLSTLTFYGKTTCHIPVYCLKPCYESYFTLGFRGVPTRETFSGTQELYVHFHPQIARTILSSCCKEYNSGTTEVKFGIQHDANK